MIGVVAPGSRREVVSEFFELFKTPWEFVDANRNYEVVLIAGDAEFDGSLAKLVLHYSAAKLAMDAAEGVAIDSRKSDRVLMDRCGRLPVFKECLAFRTEGDGLRIEGESQVRASYHRVRNNQHVVRVGFDLFAEIETLLTIGQDAQFAQTPTIDRHIAFIRELMIQSGASFVEIPPAPAGHPFVACLTHDVDHPRVAFHKLDHTACGFLLRATVGSALDFLKRKIKVRELLRNLLAAMKLPFVYLGWAEDFWAGFERRYSAVEKGLPSTYFILPFKGIPGRTREGEAPKLRASGYGAKEIEKSLASIRDSGCEVATHGINAWLTAEEACREMREVQAISNGSERGVRMHWLYFDEQSPAVLERAGANYDSTVGYRDTVGFRSGTTQAFKPFNADHLLELPLTVMDTALFYPAYLDLSQAEAVPILRETVARVAEFGGCITVNWHDRSLAPERQWRESYEALLEDLRGQNAWFATASQAAAWFQNRRSAKFQYDEKGERLVGITTVKPSKGGLPGLQLRIYSAQNLSRDTAPGAARFMQMEFSEDIKLSTESGDAAELTADCEPIHL